MSSQIRPEGRPVPGASGLEAALRGVVEDVTRHSRKNSEAIDVLVHALKAVHQDLQQEKVRAELLETRLRKQEADLARLAGVVDALRRQGWLQ
ncbi:MAG TPA: hypothetical protein VGQ33_16535 [Vicinamibacteria bacterium]|jgi:hypothetical protein|nr:hypothetical protein [Vicinamibacteria bacterium]